MTKACASRLDCRTLPYLNGKEKIGRTTGRQEPPARSSLGRERISALLPDGNRPTIPPFLPLAGRPSFARPDGGIPPDKDKARDAHQHRPDLAR